MARKRRKNHMMNIPERLPEIPEEPAEIAIRLGLRPVATSKGRSDGTNRFVVPGAVVTLPRHEAENLVNMGYAARV